MSDPLANGQSPGLETHGHHREISGLRERQVRLEQLGEDTKRGLGELGQAVTSLTRGFSRLASDIREVATTAKSREGRIDMRTLVPVLVVAMSIASAVGSYFITPLQTKIELMQQFNNDQIKGLAGTTEAHTTQLIETKVKVALQELSMATLAKDVSKLAEAVSDHHERNDEIVQQLVKQNVTNQTSAPIIERYQLEKYTALSDAMVRLEERLNKMGQQSAATDARLTDLTGRIDLLSNRLSDEISRRARSEEARPVIQVPVVPAVK